MTEQATNLATITPEPQAVQQSPMMALAEKAIAAGSNMEQIERLMDMHERWESNEARKAFDKAMAAFKADPPHITKNKNVSFGAGGRQTNYDHATLDHVSETIARAMAPHGLSFRWATEQEGQSIRVTCIVAHEQGHQERVTLGGAPDNSGSKNSIQQVGSTITYLQRYTLLAATGLAASDQDDDGVSAGKTVEKISEDHLRQLEDMLEATGSDLARFKAWAFAGIPDAANQPLTGLRADQFQPAMDMLRKKLKKEAE